MTIRLGTNPTPYYPTSTGAPTSTSANVTYSPTSSSSLTSSSNPTSSTDGNIRKLSESAKQALRNDIKNTKADIDEYKCQVKNLETEVDKLYKEAEIQRVGMKNGQVNSEFAMKMIRQIYDQIAKLNEQINNLNRLIISLEYDVKRWQSQLDLGYESVD